jgi:hypothetical protein
MRRQDRDMVKVQHVIAAKCGRRVRCSVADRFFEPIRRAASAGPFDIVHNPPTASRP